MSGLQKSSATAYGGQCKKARGAVWCLCRTAPQSVPPYRLPCRHTLAPPGMHAACLHTPACIARGSKHFILTDTVEMRKITVITLRCNIPHPPVQTIGAQPFNNEKTPVEPTSRDSLTDCQKECKETKGRTEKDGREDGEGQEAERRKTYDRTEQAKRPDEKLRMRSGNTNGRLCCACHWNNILCKSALESGTRKLLHQRRPMS